MDNSNPLVTACTWISRLAWLHFCWLFLVCAGGVLFGVIPASVIVLTMTRRYLNGYRHIGFAVLRTEMKREFIRTNKSGYCVALPLFSAAYYMVWGIERLDGVIIVAVFALFPLLLFGLALFVAMLFQMSIYQYVGVKQDISNGLSLLFRQKSAVVFGIVLTIFTLWLGYVIPIIFLFFGITPILCAVMYVLWLNNSRLRQVL